MDPPPLGTISPGAIEGSHGSFSAPDDSSSLDDGRFHAYLVLRFPDGQWLMRTPTVTIGRDETLKHVLENRATLKVDNNQEMSGSDYAHSVASDDSENASEDEEHPTGTRFKYSHCGGIRRILPGDTARNDRGDEPFLPIHPPVDKNNGLMKRFTAISKEHARIEVNSTGVFIEVLGRNGLFVDRKFWRNTTTAQLNDGDVIGIGGLDIEVILDPSRALPENAIEDEEISDASSAAEVEADEDLSMSDASTPPTDSRPLIISTSEEAEDAKAMGKVVKPGGAKPMTLTALHKRHENESEDVVRARIEQILPGELIEKRKGPGRPPANGVISKRALSEMIKAKKLKEGVFSGSDPPAELIKATPTNDADDESAAKAKAKKRKRSESAADTKAAEGDRKKPDEPPRSPSPTEDQFTPAQLEKPELTYALMIYKILKDVQPTQLNLQQLYKEVKNRWPYFRFKKDTTGWESSVRHTIKQHYFKQGERDGKGYKYTVNADVEPPTQKSKPAPTSTQPTPYMNGQYVRPPPYAPYGAHPNAGAYRPPYAGQSHYPYQMQTQRPPLNGAPPPLQYSNQYSTQGLRAPPSSSSQAGPSAQPNTPTAQRPANPPATPSNPVQQYRPPSRPNATGQAPFQTGAGAAAQLPNASRPAQQTASPAPPAQGHQFAGPSSTASPRPPSSAPNTAQSPFNTGAVPPASRPPLQQHQQPRTPTPGALAAERPLPSEEIRNGRVPQVLTDFVNNMRKMCKDLPASTVNESVRRAEDAIDWVMKNLNGNPDDEQGKSHLWRHLVTLVQETITLHDRQERERRAKDRAAAGLPVQAASPAPAGASTASAAPAAQATTNRPAAAASIPANAPATPASAAPATQPATAPLSAAPAPASSPPAPVASPAPPPPAKEASMDATPK